MIKLWEFLNNKKTVIGAILKAIADIGTAAGYPEVATIVDQIGNLFLAVGLGDKARKHIVDK